MARPDLRRPSQCDMGAGAPAAAVSVGGNDRPQPGSSRLLLSGEPHTPQYSAIRMCPCCAAFWDAGQNLQRSTKPILM